MTWILFSTAPVFSVTFLKLDIFLTIKTMNLNILFAEGTQMRILMLTILGMIKPFLFVVFFILANQCILICLNVSIEIGVFIIK